MLVRHDVVFVFWVGRLVVRGDVDGFVGEVGGAVEFLVDGQGGLVGWLVGREKGEGITGGTVLLRRGRRDEACSGGCRCVRNL